MDELLKKILNAAGVSGYESQIARIMHSEFKRACGNAESDAFGNVIARAGKGKKRIMLAAHMDEVGFLIKHINKDGFLNFIKIGGIDDRVLIGQRLLVKAKSGDIMGIIGVKPPHLLKEEEKKAVVKYSEMFIDIGAGSLEAAQKMVAVADVAIFEPNAGVLEGRLCYGKAVDDRVGCYCLIKIMERLKKVNAEVFAVATAQEEVGLKGARTSSFKIAPDFAIAIDTTSAGDYPGIKETESSLKLGKGASITVIEAGGRGLIVNEKTKELFVRVAEKHKIKYQMDVLEGGMTDGAIINMNREGIPTGVLSVPARYVHSPTAVFSMDDVEAVISLAVKSVEELAR